MKHTRTHTNKPAARFVVFIVLLLFLSRFLLKAAVVVRSLDRSFIRPAGRPAGGSVCLLIGWSVASPSVRWLARWLVGSFACPCIRYARSFVAIAVFMLGGGRAVGVVWASKQAGCIFRAHRRGGYYCPTPHPDYCSGGSACTPMS